MVRLSLILASLAAASAARAGEVACRFEAGVVVVAAEVAGIAGDYILDTGTALSALHETKAQAEGIAAWALIGDVRLAGETVVAAPLAVVDLDARGWNLPTPLAGVIGADVLKAYVVDVSFAPCRVRLSVPRHAPRFRGRAIPLAWDLGRPTARASVADDAREIIGDFVLATGASAPVRLADDLAEVPGAGKPAELYPEGVWLARLPKVTFARLVGRDVPAGLMKAEGDVVGVLGGPVLAHFRLRFDFPAGRLIVARAP